MGGEVQLGEVAEIIMGQSPPGETYNEHGDGLPFFQGVADFNYRHPTPRVFCTAPSRIAQPGDILLSVRAPIGRVNVADRRCAIGRGLSIIRAKAPEDGRYLEFALRMLEATWEAIEGSGSVFGNATRRDLETLGVPWPESECDRRAIAHILGTLDDKIELNRRMSETLEQMARALFKSWFVDFEPVRAKMEGRWQRGQSLPGLPAHLYDLFPDRLVDSELGEIPEGWEVKSLDEIAHFLNGLALQKYPPKEGRSLPVIKIAQLRSGNTLGADQASADLDPDYLVADGDILFSWSGSLVCVVWAGGPGALNQHLFKVTSKRYPRWLCYFGVHAHLEEFRHVAAGKATTMGHIQRHHLSEAKLAVPPFPLLEVMDRCVSPIFEASWKRHLESRTLAALRDALLPKLISGELRVRDAERFLKERGL
ncbi:MAG: restriction endonuclease subunit S [Meiothermus sp.]|uniref:restriction endonuclease subunit S n=1 Tax=Meiothermus sp. TaxID=1955249 RepID=UPI0028CDC4F4|nr:restriction endonuclease subunit S [Meiothermus sp.]MDT7920159.1 restriction endonuclease subunit S [Meiothermus sp.]